MPKKRYIATCTLEGAIESWDCKSSDGPPVTITADPASFPKNGEFKCQVSKDGVYDVLIHHQISKPMMQSILQIINCCDIEVKSAPASAYKNKRTSIVITELSAITRPQG